MSGSEVGIGNPNHIAVSADLSATTWKTAASHEVFTVTGLVRLRMWIECTETVTSDGAATIQFGTEAATDAIIGSTDATALAANDLWYDTSPATVLDTYANTVLDYIVTGLDIGYEIGTAATTNGTLVFHCVWDALNSTGNVAPGAGGAMA